MHFDMKDVIDIHVHAGPSVADRKVDMADMLRQGTEHGYRAYVAKDHYFPTVMGADLVTKSIGDGTCEAFGSIVLNNSVGGINVHAVDAACAMGARIVYMPTVSAQNHIAQHQGGFLGAGKLKVPEKPIYYLDELGQLKPEVVEVLSFLAKYYPEVTLATGHGTVAEINQLIDKAVELGVKKILVNHPYFHIGASLDDTLRWVQQGAFIELIAVVFNEVQPAPHHIPFDIVVELFEKVGYERLVIESDMGQRAYISPVEGLKKFAELMIEHCHATKEQLRVMMHDNPAYLIGIEEKP